MAIDVLEKKKQHKPANTPIQAFIHLIILKVRCVKFPRTGLEKKNDKYPNAIARENRNVEVRRCLWVRKKSPKHKGYSIPERTEAIARTGKKPKKTSAPKLLSITLGIIIKPIKVKFKNSGFFDITEPAAIDGKKNRHKSALIKTPQKLKRPTSVISSLGAAGVLFSIRKKK